MEQVANASVLALFRIVERMSTWLDTSHDALRTRCKVRATS